MLRIFTYVLYLIGFFSPLRAKGSPPPELDLQHSIHVITGEWLETEVDLEIPGPFGFEIKRVLYQESRNLTQFIAGWQYNLPDFGKPEIPRKKFTPPPKRIFHYSYDEEHRLTKIEARHPVKKTTLEWVEISYDKEGCSLISHAGDRVRYGIYQDPELGNLLDHVEKKGERCEYNYISHPIERRLLLSERRSKGEWLKFEYDKKGRITKVLATEEGGNHYRTIKQLDYEPFCTNSTDQNGVLTKYHYNKDCQIEKIEIFNSFNNLYKVEEFEWKGNLIKRKTILDASQQILLQMRWEYDVFGNCTAELFEGCLTGKSQQLESYQKKYLYDHKNRVIEEQEENGAKKLFFYDQKTDLLSAIMTLSNGIVSHRSFYHYDEENLICAIYQDDGTSFDESSWDNVHSRSFQRILSKNPQGLPCVEIEGFFDLDTREERILRKSLKSYNVRGELLTEATQDSQEKLLLSSSYKYRESGGLIFSEDSTGKKIFYENYETQVFEENHLLIYRYRMDKKLEQEEVFKDGKKIQSITYAYNDAGQVISTIDLGGNTTTYTYDCFGRKIAEKSPEGGETFYTYDALDRIISIQNALNQKKTFTYNARGDLLKTHFPDDSFEENEYTLQGLLKKRVLKNKMAFNSTYDPLGRLISKEHLNANGECFEWVKYCYEGALLKEELYSSSISILHRYDFAGRCLQSKTLPSGRKVDYSYDEAGNLVSQKEWSNENEALENILPKKASSTSIEKMEYVLNNEGKAVLQRTIYLANGSKNVLLHNAQRQVTESQVFSASNTLLTKIQYFYDLIGNKTQETHAKIDSGDIVGSISNSWAYDAFSNITQVTLGLGSREEKTTSYRYNIEGNLAEIILPDGCLITCHYNAENRLCELIASDGSFHYTISYNAFGQLKNQTDITRYLSGERQYTSEGQIAKETLFNGLEIKHLYDLLGRQISLTLPDQSQVQYHYKGNLLEEVTRTDAKGMALYSHQYLHFDEKGRPLKAKLIGNLGMIDYSFTNERLAEISSPYFKEKGEFDDQNRLVKLMTRSCETTFKYDSYSQITEEKGLVSHSYAFDNFGNLQTKDKTQFSSNALLELFSNEGMHLKYDLKGNLIEKSTEEASFLFKYDALNRLVEVTKNGILVHDYVYDIFHRRLIDTAPFHQTRYLYDGNWEMGAYQDELTPKELRILGATETPDHGEAIALELNGEVFAPLYDLRGSLSTLVSLKNPEYCIDYTYSSFGEGSLGQAPWGFANKRTDPETGLIHFGRRDYDPELARFISPDPLGFEDGINRYALTHSDPLNQKDLFGLKSIFHTALSSLSNYASMGLDQLLHHFIGSGFLLLLGYQITEPEKGVYGLGELNNQVRVSFINGILTDYASLTETLQGLSKSHGGVNIHFVYRPTKGWVWDILRSVLVNFGYVSQEARQLAADWKTMIQDMGGVEGGGKIIHYAHSIGSIETLRALSCLTPEEQKMIEVYAFGSPSLTIENPNYQVRHFVSVRDGVSLIDFIAFTKACFEKRPDVLFMGSFWGLPFVDHLFCGQTYQDLWKAMGRTFTEWHGSLI